MAKPPLTGWDDPARHAELASMPAGELAIALAALIEWGLATHAADPAVLRSHHLASPLRAALHVARVAGLDDHTAGALFELAWRHAGATAASRRALAADPQLPDAIYLRLVTDADGSTRQRLADNDGIGAPVVAALAAESQPPHIRSRAARRSAATADTLDLLARSTSDASVCESVAAHPATRPAARRAIAQLAADRVAQACTGSPDTPPELIDAVVRRTAPDAANAEWILVAAGRNPATPPATLAHLATAHADEPRVLRAVAGNPHAPAETLRALVAHAFTHADLAGNASAPDEVLAQLAASGDPDIRTAAVGARALSAAQLAKLADDEDEAIRAGVATNPHTDARTRARLVADPSGLVRRALVIAPHVRSALTNAAGPADFAARDATCHVGADVLATLASDPDPLVRMFLTENGKTTAVTLATLARDADKRVRFAVAFHPNVTPDILGVLLADRDEDVRAGALRNRRAPRAGIVELLRAREKRQMPSVAAGKGDAAAIGRHPFASPGLLACFTRTPEQALLVADHPRVLLEDLIPLAPARAPAPQTASASAWVPSGGPGPFVAGAPAKRGKVPRWTVEWKEGGDPAPVDRAGGLPSPWGDEPWPVCGDCVEPMTFALQLIGVAAGGRVDLGDAAALQVFVCASDHGCAAYDPLSPQNAALLRRRPLGAGAVAAPVPFASGVQPPLAATFALAYDDARLDKPAARWSKAAREAAWTSANVEKVGGVGVYGNPPAQAKCPTCQAPLEFLGQFWAVYQPFASGSAYLHACPHRHVVAYQAVN